MGPGLVFARWYLPQVPPNRRILLVPVASGESPLVAPEPPTWNPGVSGSLYTSAISHTRAATAAAGPRARLVAILWVQGESDGHRSATGAQYQVQLDLLIEGMRTELSAPDVPFILGQMVPDYLGTGTRAEINAVHIDTPRRNERTAFAYGPVGPAFHNGDGVHYNAPGQRELGRALFDAYILAQANVRGVAPNSPGAVAAAQVSPAAVAVSWERPASRVTGYNIRYSRTGGSSWSSADQAESIDNAAVIGGLSSGVQVMVEVAALNEDGRSGWSAPSPAVTLR
jgi:Carbohydrate esterase, sialic acid-specific acetylesterase/Fibronectin type III domain